MKRRENPDEYEFRKRQTLGRENGTELPLVELPSRPLKVALILGFLPPNSRGSAKPSAQKGRRFRRPFKLPMSTVFRILTETNVNSTSIKSTKTELVSINYTLTDPLEAKSWNLRLITFRTQVSGSQRTLVKTR